MEGGQSASGVFVWRYWFNVITAIGVGLTAGLAIPSARTGTGESSGEEQRKLLQPFMMKRMMTASVHGLLWTCDQSSDTGVGQAYILNECWM